MLTGGVTREERGRRSEGAISRGCLRCDAPRQRYQPAYTKAWLAWPWPSWVVGRKPRIACVGWVDCAWATASPSPAVGPLCLACNGKLPVTAVRWPLWPWKSVSNPPHPLSIGHCCTWATCLLATYGPIKVTLGERAPLL